MGMRCPIKGKKVVGQSRGRCQLTSSQANDEMLNLIKVAQVSLRGYLPSDERVSIVEGGHHGLEPIRGGHEGDET